MNQILFHVDALEKASRETLANFIKERPECAPCVWGFSGPYSVVTKVEDGKEEVIMAIPDALILPELEAFLMEFAQDNDDISVIGINAKSFADKLKKRFLDATELAKGVEVYCGEYNHKNGQTEYKEDAYPFEWTVIVDKAATT